MPPEQVAKLLSDGGYLPRRVPLIKRILAITGQTVCRKGFIITVDGIEMGAALGITLADGRPLPDWQGCRIIGEDDIFLMNWDEPASLDGRYFGALPVSSIVGRVAPLWTFEKQ